MAEIMNTKRVAELLGDISQYAPKAPLTVSQARTLGQELAGLRRIEAEVKEEENQHLAEHLEAIATYRAITKPLYGCIKEAKAKADQCLQLWHKQWADRCEALRTAAEAAEAAGNIAEAHSLLVQSEEPCPMTEDLTVSESDDIEALNIEALPLTYMVPDLRAIKQAIKDGKDIPGVTVGKSFSFRRVREV